MPKKKAGVVKAITNESQIFGANAERGIHLLFPAGKRPSANQIISFLAPSSSVSVSFDPSKATSGLAKESGDRDCTASWLELHCDGLTFDLKNLADEDASGSDKDKTERVYLLPSDHLKGGEGRLPVLRSMMALAASLADFLPDLQSFYWPPARTENKPSHFVQAIDRWLSGGAFPVPELITTQIQPDGSILSRGLAFITGQELKVDNTISADANVSARLAARLLSQLVLQGRIETPDRITGPDGSPLQLELSPDTSIIIVRRC